jgi:polyisoprenoid-binding protein YceI
MTTRSHRAFVAVGALALVASAGLVVGFGALAQGSAQPAAATPASSAGAVYGVDGVHSSVVFAVKHNNVSWFFGRFDKVDGKFNLDQANPASSTLDISVDAGSVSSGNDGRDKHLKGPDFFSTSEFPKITFKSTSVKPGTAKNTYEVAGDLTLRGVTKPITITVEDTGRGAGARGGEVAGFITTFTINRGDYGVKYMLGSKALGDEVKLTVSLQGKK